CSAAHHLLHSFPTRRSSDLLASRAARVGGLRALGRDRMQGQVRTSYSVSAPADAGASTVLAMRVLEQLESQRAPPWRGAARVPGAAVLVRAASPHLSLTAASATTHWTN